MIERLDRATLSTQLIPFNLARAVIDGDAQHNLALQPGDIVTILSRRTCVYRRTARPAWCGSKAKSPRSGFIRSKRAKPCRNCWAGWAA